MRLLRGIGRWFWRFMIVFSFIVNFVLIVILLLAGLFIFQIKNQVADPLIGGLHSTAAGLSDATIDWTIPVRERIPIALNIPLDTQTDVRLTAPVNLEVDAFIDIPGLGGARNIPATVRLTLPQDLVLPVALNLVVPVDEEIDVSLDVRAVIPISQTQMADPIETLGLLFEPLAIGLYNLPNDFNQAGDFVSTILNRDGSIPWSDFFRSLLLSTDGTGFNQVPYDPWVGYSQTAGLGYNGATLDYVDAYEAMETGLIPPGGIPALDAQIDRRAPYYGDDVDPNALNEATVNVLNDNNLPPYTWNGTYYDYYLAAQGGSVTQPLAPVTEANTPVEPEVSAPSEEAPPPTVGGSDISTPTPDTSSGIIPTPSSP
jgi:hypothetical protein